MWVRWIMIYLIYSIATITHVMQKYAKAQNKYLSENRASVERTTDTCTAHTSIWKSELLHSERGQGLQIMTLIELYIFSRVVPLFFIFKFSTLHSYCVLSREQKIKVYLKLWTLSACLCVCISCLLRQPLIIFQLFVIWSWQDFLRGRSIMEF